MRSVLNYLLRPLGWELVRSDRLDELLKAEEHLRDVLANDGIDPSTRVGVDEPWDMGEFIRRWRAEKKARTKVTDLPGDVVEYVGPADLDMEKYKVVMTPVPMRPDGNGLPVPVRTG